MLPKSERANPENLANIALKYIDALFDIEREMRESSAEERKAGREEKSQEVVDKFKRWLDKAVLGVLPKSALGKAIGYCQNQWLKLIVFLKDGRLELDNNRAERSIKPFVIGRKNWLFANTPRGARTSALIYSIVETAKENKLDPSRYIQYVLERLQGIDPRDKEAVDSLLPWSESVQSALRTQPSLAV